jgi:hypothetical protein
MSEVKPKRSPDVKWRSEDENLVLYTPSESRIIVLNRTAGFIWKHADGEKTLGEIADEVVTEYGDVTKEKALKDVTKVIDNLKSKGLVMV